MDNSLMTMMFLRIHVSVLLFTKNICFWEDKQKQYFNFEKP